MCVCITYIELIDLPDSAVVIVVWASVYVSVCVCDCGKIFRNSDVLAVKADIKRYIGQSCDSCKTHEKSKSIIVFVVGTGVSVIFALVFHGYLVSTKYNKVTNLYMNY